MALVHDATCPKCGQVYCALGFHNTALRGPAVETCGECLVREAEEAAHDARRSAYRVAHDRFPSAREFAVATVDNAKFKVLLEMVCETLGQTTARPQRLRTLKKMRAFWERVRKEVES